MFNKRKLVYTFFPLLMGMTFGAIFNLSFNQSPAPKVVHAASTPTPTPKPTATPKPTSTPTPTNTPTPTPIPAYTISGFIFIDMNNNGTHNASDSNYTPGATVSASLNNIVITTTQSTNTGKFSFTGLLNGSYNISLVTPDKFSATTPNPILITINNSNEAGVKFGIFPDNWTTVKSGKTVACSDLREFVKDHCGD